MANGAKGVEVQKWKGRKGKNSLTATRLPQSFVTWRLFEETCGRLAESGMRSAGGVSLGWKLVAGNCLSWDSHALRARNDGRDSSPGNWKLATGNCLSGVIEMSLATALQILYFAWPVSEVILGLVTRAKRYTRARRDRGSLALLWIAIGVAIPAAVYVRVTQGRTMPFPLVWQEAISLLLLLGGLILRWTAIITLGRLFTPTVSIQEDHRVVQTGLYRFMRHPSYTGLLVAFLGLGFSYGNWVGLAVLIVPITAALLYRIRVEERLMKETFGDQYIAYSASTKRLIPGIY